MKTNFFQSCGYCWVFQICWHIECSTFTASSFRIWNSSTGIPSLPLALFVVMLSKAHLTSHSKMSGSRLVIIIFVLLTIIKDTGMVRCICLQGVYNLEESKTNSRITVKQNRVREVGPSTTQPVYFSAKKKGGKVRKSLWSAVLKWAEGKRQTVIWHDSSFPQLFPTFSHISCSLYVH